MKRSLLLITGVANAQFWPQWALNPQHTGQVSVAGQTMNRELADIVYGALAAVGAGREPG
ncbi:MAG TPA: hypothetical protein VKB88_14235 [Bryobacteraceae bacterium]|nr:hypothetical protein [Bryobacteraceae bacterium]